MMFVQKEKGQTLLETLLALSVSVLILSAITVVVISSLNNAQFAKNQNLANQYAQEGIEVARKTRDSSGWTGFLAFNVNHYCLSQSQTNLIARLGVSCGQNVGIFVRGIDIEHDNSTDCAGASSNGSKITSTVSWSDGKCPVGNTYCHKVELVSCFYNID